MCTHIYIYITIVTFKVVLNVRAFSYIRHLYELFFFLYNTFSFAYVFKYMLSLKIKFSGTVIHYLCLNPEKFYCFPSLGSLPDKCTENFNQSLVVVSFTSSI